MAPPSRKSELDKRSDSIQSSRTEESQEAGACKREVFAKTSLEIFKPYHTVKRKSRLNAPFKSQNDSFVTILKKNARDLSIELTSNDDLVLSFKTSKQDLGILHATKNQQLLPWKKICGSSREHSRISMRAGMHNVEIDRLESQTEYLAPSEHYDENDSGSKLKVSSFSIVSESNTQSLTVSACSVVSKERKKETKGQASKFGSAIASTSKAYGSIHYKGEVLSECAVNEFDYASFSNDEYESLSINSEEDYVVTSSSFSDRKPRMNTTIVRRLTDTSESIETKEPSIITQETKKKKVPDTSESIDTKEPSIITQETQKKKVRLFVEPAKMDSEPIKYDEKSVRPAKKPTQLDMEQIKPNMQSTKPQVHTDYAFKFWKNDLEDIDDDDEEPDVKSVYTEDPDSKTFKYVLNELVDYRAQVQTGYFRDQRRRIDIVIVVDETSNAAIEQIKEDFFRNCLNSGLEFELETPLLEKNSGLVFVKVHAPHSIILALAKHFGARKYFKNNHMEITKETTQDERGLLSAIRYIYICDGTEHETILFAEDISVVVTSPITSTL